MADFPDHFSDRAGRYAEHRPTYPPALAAALTELAPGRGLAWDAGCGPGRLTRRLAPHFRRVVGTDASRAQLVGARRLSPQPEGRRVAYFCALAERAPIASGTVDLVTAAQAAHWFDLELFYREVRRVADRGARVALVTYGPPTVGPAVDPVLDRFHDGVLADHWPPQSRYVAARYRNLPFPFEELEAPELILEERWSAADLLGYVGTWSGTRALEREEGSGALEAFTFDLLEAWGAPERVRSVRWPLTVRAGVVAR